MAKRRPPAIRGTVTVLARVLLCAVFVAAVAVPGASHAEGLAGLVAARGLFGAKAALAGCTGLLIAGCFSVALGYRARIGAALLLAFLVLTTFSFHGFGLGTLLSAEARAEQFFRLAANLSVIGAMLFIVANGPGEMSLDGRR